jgi:hypothetical protein
MKKLNLNTWRSRTANTKTCARKCAKPGVIIAGMALALLLLGGTGTDARGENGNPAVIQAGFALTPAPEIKACLPLLKIVQQQKTVLPQETPAPAGDSATGKALLVGLLLGVQQISGPPETGLERQKQALPKRNLPAAGQDSGQAIAIAAYRRCVSQKTLEARNTVLNDWRWTR